MPAIFFSCAILLVSTSMIFMPGGCIPCSKEVNLDPAASQLFVVSWVVYMNHIWWCILVFKHQHQELSGFLTQPAGGQFLAWQAEAGTNLLGATLFIRSLFALRSVLLRNYWGTSSTLRFLERPSSVVLTATGAR